MRPVFLLPETVSRQNGASTEVALAQSGRPMRLTLGITRIIEQESLDVSILGSHDKEQWTELASFPHKCYCGTYSMLLDLARHPEVRYLRAAWRMGRWAKRELAPLFGFYLLAEEGKLERRASAG